MRSSLAVWSVAGLLLGGVSVPAAAQHDSVTAAADSRGVAAYVPAYEANDGALKSGPEVVAFYFGAASCGPCNQPKVTEAVQHAKTLLRAQAATRGATFAIIGVANDWDVDTALAFLKKEGPFDELIVGRNFLNSAWIRHVWRAHVPVTGMPSIVIIEHDITVGKKGLTVASDRVLLAMEGGETLVDWVNRGAPVKLE